MNRRNFRRTTMDRRSFLRKAAGAAAGAAVAPLIPAPQLNTGTGTHVYTLVNSPQPDLVCYVDFYRRHARNTMVEMRKAFEEQIMWR
jgi:hypothetical protein